MYFHMLGYHSLSSSDRAAALLSVAEAALQVAVELFQQGEQLRLFSGVQAGEHLLVPLHALGLSATAELPRGVTPEQAAQFACAQGVSRVSFSKDIQAAELAALQGGGEGTVWERAEAGVRGALLRLLPLCGCQNRA